MSAAHAAAETETWNAPMSGSTLTVTAANGTWTTNGAVATTIPLAVPPWMNAKPARTWNAPMSGSTPGVTAANGTWATNGAVASSILLAVPLGMNAKLAAVAPVHQSPVMNAKIAMATMVTAYHATLWKCLIQTLMTLHLSVMAGTATPLISMASPSCLGDLVAAPTTLHLSASPLAATMSRSTAVPSKMRSAGTSTAMKAERLTMANCASDEVANDV